MITDTLMGVGTVEKQKKQVAWKMFSSLTAGTTGAGRPRSRPHNGLHSR